MNKHMVECKDCHKPVDEKNLVKGRCKNCAAKKVDVTDNIIINGGKGIFYLAIIGKVIKEFFDLRRSNKSWLCLYEFSIY